ncbi:hypothetical protein NA57DRAFT_51358 [Rhizodiscina lignyota]|uniref:Uncharacterized protein n=1 Tax=Rhizodiscina lignyota TaxID=1504668 RepID=A0A9P4ISE8_9PEZI|nr:hypothetical protein NA57DRAFT_51358 [Rhizodiscina lignyota]
MGWLLDLSLAVSEESVLQYFEEPEHMAACMRIQSNGMRHRICQQHLGFSERPLLIRESMRLEKKVIRGHGRGVALTNLNTTGHTDPTLTEIDCTLPFGSLDTAVLGTCSGLKSQERPKTDPQILSQDLLRWTTTKTVAPLDPMWRTSDLPGSRVPSHAS